MIKLFRKRGCFFWIGSAALLLGGLLYLLFRPGTHIARWATEFPALYFWREALRWMECDFLKYYFADYLWAVSLSCGLHFIFAPGWRGSIICTGVAAVYGAVLEGLQFCGLISGTGDLWDIGMFILAGITVNIINLIHQGVEKNEKGT